MKSPDRLSANTAINSRVPELQGWNRRTRSRPARNSVWTRGRPAAESITESQSPFGLVNVLTINSLKQIPQVFTYALRNGEELLATLRVHCAGIGGENLAKSARPCDVRYVYNCEHCDGIGYTGINPALPTVAPQGSQERVTVMAARYRGGSPLFNPDDLNHESALEGIGPFHEMRSGRPETAKTKRNRYDIGFSDDDWD